MYVVLVSTGCPCTTVDKHTNAHAHCCGRGMIVVFVVFLGEKAQRIKREKSEMKHNMVTKRGFKGLLRNNKHDIQNKLINC